MRVLLVEDNLKLAVAIGERLERAGFGLDRVGTIQYASSALEAYPYSVVLLDRRLPDGDGLSLVPSIRRLQPASFILVLTALDAIDDRIEGLDGGADDYLTKPFSFDEMLARVRAGLRRPGRERTPPVRIGALSLDLIERTAFVGDCPVSFLRRELALLVALMTRAGCVVSRESLIAAVYGMDEDVQDYALKALVWRVRQHLAELDAGVEIHSERGVGYMIAKAKPRSKS